MAQINKTTIRSIAIAAAGILALSIQNAAAKPAAKEKAQGLWVGSQAYISEFQGPALEQSGEPAARISFDTKDYFTALSITFGRHKNLWVTSLGTGNGLFPIVEIGRADIASLKTGKLAKRKVVIIPGEVFGSSASTGLGFDAAGDLWVATVGGRAIMKFRRNQIEQSGNPRPRIVIASPVFFPWAIRFDASDNLWAIADDQVWRFAPRDRAASGPPNPSLRVDPPDGLSPVDLAFDSAGNLWLAGPASSGDEIEMITAGDLAGTGEISPTAAVSITSSAFGVPVDSGTCLGGIDFDHSGDLWTSVTGTNGICEANTQVVEFTPGQLSAGGNLTPSVTIGQNTNKTNLFLPGPIRFGPALK